MPLVGVLWNDAHGEATRTVSPEDGTLTAFHKSLQIITYGLLMRDDSTGVTVVAEDYGDGDYRGPTFIPRELVCETWVISPNPAKRPKKKVKAKAAPEPSTPSSQGTVEAPYLHLSNQMRGSHETPPA